MFLSRVFFGLDLVTPGCIAGNAGIAAVFDNVNLRVAEILPMAAVALLLGAATGAVWVGFFERRRRPSLDTQRGNNDELNELLLLARCPDDVGRAIEKIVRRVSGASTARLEIRRPVWTDAFSSGPRAAARGDLSSASAGDSLTPRRLEFDSPRSCLVAGGRGLEFRLVHQDAAIGVLRVGPKSDGEPFSHRDIELLCRTSRSAALALARVISREDLENSLRRQAAAFRDEREALIETLSAEVLHEMRYPINFFRSIFQRAAQGVPLEPEDIDIGREEVDRLERLVSGLRRIAKQPVERHAVEIDELLARAEGLLRDRLAGRIDADLAEDLAVRCDPDKATQILVNLLANALDAVAEVGGDVGVKFCRTEQGADLTVWDTGIGFGDDTTKLFAPWYTTKARGTGLGLAITSRLVRAHGWQIEARRQAGRTLFVVKIAGEDLVGHDQPRQSGTRQISVDQGDSARERRPKQEGAA